MAQAADYTALPNFGTSHMVAEKVVREGLYRDYEVDIVQQYDDPRSTFKEAKETKSKKGTYGLTMNNIFPFSPSFSFNSFLFYWMQESTPLYSGSSLLVHLSSQWRNIFGMSRTMTRRISFSLKKFLNLQYLQRRREVECSDENNGFHFVVRAAFTRIVHK